MKQFTFDFRQNNILMIYRCVKIGECSNSAETTSEYIDRFNEVKFIKLNFFMRKQLGTVLYIRDLNF